jgi:hypothetical protein
LLQNRHLCVGIGEGAAQAASFSFFDVGASTPHEKINTQDPREEKTMKEFTEPRENSPVRMALVLVAALSAAVLISGCNKPVDEQTPAATPAETTPPAEETPPPAETPPATDPAVPPTPTDSTTTPTTTPTDPAAPPSDPATAPTPTDSDSAPKN